MPTTRANCSSELVWAITRDTSCFRMKQRSTNKSGLGKSGAEFTKEPNNLTGRNTWKYSALSNAKSVGLEAAADGGCVLTTKSRKSGRVQKVRRISEPSLALAAEISARRAAPARLAGACAPSQ